MKRHKYQAILKGLTASSRKVLDATPINEAWTAQQITSELRRLGQAKDFRLVEGCLHSLVTSGIVVEVRPHVFRRVEIREPMTVDERIEEIEMSVPDQISQLTSHPEEPSVANTTITKSSVKKISPANPMETLASLATKARSMADDMRNLADEIDLAALQAEEHVAGMKQAAQRLQALQSLLKDIGTEV